MAWAAADIERELNALPVVLWPLIPSPPLRIPDVARLKRCLQTPLLIQNFCNALLCILGRFSAPLPVRNFSPAPLPCHRAWALPLSQDVAKLRFSFQGMRFWILAPASDAPVCFVRGVSPRPSRPRTPIANSEKERVLKKDFGNPIFSITAAAILWCRTFGVPDNRKMIKKS